MNNQCICTIMIDFFSTGIHIHIHDPNYRAFVAWYPYIGQLCSWASEQHYDISEQDIEMI